MATTTTTATTVFVDIQGFVVSERFIVKEAAVLRSETRELTHHIFRAPMHWDLLTSGEKARASWVMANHHGFRWQDGDVDYHQARSIIRGAVCDSLGETYEIARIYVKGLEKKKWLEDILGNVGAPIVTLDAEYDDIGRLEFIRTDHTFRCGRHLRCCAMENVMKLREWWLARSESLSILGSSDESRISH